ncbi:MAG TPA: DUF4136 domain-containing protein [Thermoanaerobaculia bacterium]|nr:DUF4136 domain-containing protein [Thermoanaerobaculia bacterium]
MRNLLKATLLLLLVSAAAACAHKNPPPDFSYNHATNFAGLSTYAWYDDPNWKMPQGNSIVDGQFIDRHVREAVDATLQKKGYRKVDSGTPSFFVAYHTDAAGVVSQDKYGVYSWWGWGYVDYYGTKYRKQGMLVLDVRDSGRELVWRGVRIVLVGTNPDALGNDIDRAVGLLLGEFPPSKTEAK